MSYQSSRQIDLTIPEKLIPVLEPYPYKVLYGGRGSAKSRTIAKVLLAKGLERKRLILCTRELQKSTKDSVHRVLVSQIEEMDLGEFYHYNKQGIYGKNGTEFIFEGLRNNTEAIKSMEGVDDCWCEEAENISEESWDLLIPTIRKDGAEIWISFNPADEMDDTYQRFVVNPPNDALVIQMNWRDNPWFPGILRNQMIACKEASEKKYRHIWEGEPNIDYEDAIIEPEWFEAAIDAHKRLGFEAEGIRVISFDPADDGSDAKAMARRKGSVILDVTQWLDGDITDAIPIAFDAADEMPADFLIYDSIGIGASIKVARKARHGLDRFELVGFAGSDGTDHPDDLYNDERPNKDTFINRRAQYYWHLRDRFEKTYLAVEKGRYIDPEELISLSSSIEYMSVLKSEICKIKRKRQIAASKIQIESKQDMARDGRKSPNMADAIMMAFANPPPETEGFSMSLNIDTSYVV